MQVKQRKGAKKGEKREGKMNNVRKRGWEREGKRERKEK